MIRLVKKTSSETLYWQVYNWKKSLIILSGTLGVQGREEELPLGFFESSKRVMKNLAEEKVNQGYEYVDATSLVKIAVQYHYEHEDHFFEAEEKNLKVEHLIDDILEDTGNGEVSGSEVGNGVGITFCLVVDLEIALEAILKELSSHQLIEGAEIAYLNKEGAYIGLYPEGIEFELVGEE